MFDDQVHDANDGGILRDAGDGIGHRLRRGIDGHPRGRFGQMSVQGDPSR